MIRAEVTATESELGTQSFLARCEQMLRFARSVVAPGSCCAEPRRLHDTLDAAMRVQNLSTKSHSVQSKQAPPEAHTQVAETLPKIRYSATTYSAFSLCFPLILYGPVAG